MRNISIRTKLIALICLVLIPVVLINAVRIKTDYERRLEAELRASEEFAEVYCMSFMNYLDKLWSNQYTMGITICRNANWKKTDIEDYMTSILKRNSEVRSYSWADPDGTILASTDMGLNGKSIKDREYYNRLINGEEKVISDLVLSLSDNEAILPVANGIMVENKLVGILVSVINVNRLDTIFTMKRGGTTSSYGLIDRNGLIVYRNENNDVAFEKRRIKPDSPAWKALQGEIVRVKSFSASIDNSNRMGVNYPIPQVEWVCFVTTSVDELLSMYRRDMIIDIMVLLLVTVSSFLLAAILGSRLVNSIGRLKEAAEEVTKGNFTFRTNVKGTDELAVTSQVFDEMAEHVNAKIYETEEYSKLKSQFFSTISHELKTPLNVILASTQLMERIDNSDADIYISKIQRHLGVLKQNSLRLLRLICNLIDVNKLEVCQLSISPRNLDIVRIVEDITLSIVEYTNQKDIELVFDTEIEEKIIAFDPDMIERIMLNLLSNAIKFTEKGGRIEVNIFDRQETIAISVRDNGIGIPEEMQDKIFNCFTQVDNSLHRKTEGSGIGLSLVKALVELHGGYISIASELGGGSEFIVELPNTVTKEEELQKHDDVCNTNVERIRVEFSDIYL